MIDRAGRKDLARFHFPRDTSFPGTIFADEHGKSGMFIQLSIREHSSCKFIIQYTIPPGSKQYDKNHGASPLCQIWLFRL
jgi:hypothetical protein